VPILLGAYEALVSFDVSLELVSRYRGRIELAKSDLEPGDVLIVNPEQIRRSVPAK
jgi:hypothetical protein